MVPEFYVKRGVSASYLKVNTAFETAFESSIKSKELVRSRQGKGRKSLISGQEAKHWQGNC